MDNLILNSLDIHKFESHEHLLEVLPFLEEATQRLGSPNVTKTWLLTSVTPGGKTPLDYLAARQYTIFRGFLLRIHTGQEAFRPLKPSNRIYRERPPEEIKAALERLKPPICIEDYDD
jgi:hypothetical protein